MSGRRLSAILAADISGYSALMGADDVTTVADLKGHQGAVLPLVAGFGGRVIDTAGDGILAEFASVFNAVKCAIAIQEIMLERNAAQPPERRMKYRIGVNQGDILFDDARIYGDGINVAARLENLCEPGNICISGKVYDEIKGRFEIKYDYLGEQELKNISQPVPAYRIAIAGAAPVATAQALVAPRMSTGGSPRARTSALFAIAVVLGAAALWGAWEWRVGRSTGAGTAAELDLGQMLEKLLPRMPADRRQSLVDTYAKGITHRAMAFSERRQATWWTHEWPSRALAEEKVLEKCQQHYDGPCALLATDGVIAKLGPTGSLPVQEAPRVRYNGQFNPERIPAIHKSVEQRADVAGYFQAAGPKASAFHAVGTLSVVTGGSSQREVEERALKACNEAVAKMRNQTGLCYLYSSENQVVLPLRMTAPIATATPVAQPK